MYDNIERELKLLINEKVYNELLHSYDFHNPITQTNTYFDTENQDVKKQRGAVRIRTIQDKKIFTLKIRKDEYTHYEFEKEISAENINEIEDPEILNWFNQYQIPKNLHPTASFTTLRNVYALHRTSANLLSRISFLHTIKTVASNSCCKDSTW